jgi:hypothetical protein
MDDQTDTKPCPSLIWFGNQTHERWSQHAIAKWCECGVIQNLRVKVIAGNRIKVALGQYAA